MPKGWRNEAVEFVRDDLRRKGAILLWELGGD